MTTVDPVDWPSAPDALELPENEVHLWRTALNPPDDSVARLLALLSPEGRGRAARYLFDRHRRSFIVGRGFLRCILSRYLGLTPDAVAFTFTVHGKPELAASMKAPDLRFNLSHSGDWAVLAVTRGREVGIDLEQVRPRVDMEGLARRFFAPGEVAVLTSVAPCERELTFFNCWTRKEAFIKATGEGLSRPLDSFEVSLRPGEPARLLTIEGQPGEAERWSLRTFSPRPGYVGCLAVAGQGWTLRTWDWQA
jgi:4'-phosphopantetheinyl transferase